jgi:hypothetical protein
MTASADGNTRLLLELEAHREALRDFIGAAEALRAEEWNSPRHGEKWSPAQVADHLRLVYVTIGKELAGESGFRIRTPWWLRWFFRLRYLPAILRHGRFPAGVPAMREIRPAAGPFDRADLLGALLREGERFMSSVGSARHGRITHPLLGRLGLVDGLVFTTQHLRHHHKQISA